MALEPRNRPEGPPVLSLAGAGRFGAEDAAELIFRLTNGVSREARQVTVWRSRGTSGRSTGARRCKHRPNGGVEVAKRPKPSEARRSRSLFLVCSFLLISYSLFFSLLPLHYLKRLRDEIPVLFLSHHFLLISYSLFFSLLPLHYLKRLRDEIHSLFLSHHFLLISYSFSTLSFSLRFPSII